MPTKCSNPEQRHRGKNRNWKTTSERRQKLSNQQLRQVVRRQAKFGTRWHCYFPPRQQKPHHHEHHFGNVNGFSARCWRCGTGFRNRTRQFCTTDFRMDYQHSNARCACKHRGRFSQLAGLFAPECKSATSLFAIDNCSPNFNHNSEQPRRWWWRR